jgi:hypothetical protein
VYKKSRSKTSLHDVRVDASYHRITIEVREGKCVTSTSIYTMFDDPTRRQQEAAEKVAEAKEEQAKADEEAAHEERRRAEEEKRAARG